MRALGFKVQSPLCLAGGAAGAAAAGETKEGVMSDDAIADEEDAEAADEAALAEIEDGGDEIKAADVGEDEIDAELGGGAGRGWGGGNGGRGGLITTCCALAWAT